VLAGALADINSAFGGGLNVTNLSTPQGQLATSMAAIIADKDQQFLFYVSQVDPAFAAGRMQDGIGRIYFITRNPALPTTVTCTCVGLDGVTIPYGAQAQDTAGNLYTCVQAGTFTSSGTLSLAFQAATPGPTPCPANTLTKIYQTLPGWDTITNPAAGVIGALVESRSAFEARRSASVAANAQGSLVSVLGAVLSVPDVLDAYVTENTGGTPTTVGGVTLAANSLYVAVAGGAPTAIGQAIWSKKAPGCGYNGNTSVLVQDTSYAPPCPTYTVLYETPASTPIMVAVTLSNSPSVPSTALAQIQAAIISAFAGGDGGPRARIGSTLYASRYYAPVAALGSWAQIVSIEIGTSTASLFTVALSINQIPTIVASNVSLALV
jgi:uncharacterized phage protein gp47/JayE